MEQGEYKSAVGLDSLYVAEVTQDDAAGYVADTPAFFAPAVEATAEPETSQDTQYADDQAFDVSVSEGVTKVTITATAIPSEMLALVLGKEFDAATGRIYDSGGNSTPPDMALSFRSKKSNGSYRYFQYLKGKFSAPSDEAATKENKATPKPKKIVFTAMNTVHQFTTSAGTMSHKRVLGDEDTLNFSGTSWFSQVQVPGVATPSAVALSSSMPANSASGVSRTNSFTLTFNNAMKADVINRVALLDASNALVTVTCALDTTKKIVTVAHASLAATTAHTLVIAGATDIYGQILANTLVKFTTGS